MPGRKQAEHGKAKAEEGEKCGDQPVEYSRREGDHREGSSAAAQARVVVLYGPHVGQDEHEKLKAVQAPVHPPVVALDDS